MDSWISILSLVVAILAVFVGPVLTYRIMKRQIAASLETAIKQIIAPMRQAWINNLRDLIAELTSSALHYCKAGAERPTGEEHRHLILLESKIALTLNSIESDHQELEKLIHELVVTVVQQQPDADVQKLHKSVLDLARRIFKEEWNRVKERITIEEDSKRKR